MSGVIIWHTVLYVFLIFLLMPMVASYCLSAITSRTNQHLVNRFGYQAPIIFSWLGIMVHELSHAGMALLFGHKINRLVLLTNPFQLDQENRLGYVAYSWQPKNKYQQLGNFFIGLAPIIGITLLTGITTQLLWPQVFHVQTVGWQIFSQVPWWHLAVWLVIVINLNLAMNLSRADWLNVWHGILYYSLLLLLIGLVVGLFISDPWLIVETAGYWLGLVWMIDMGISILMLILAKILD
ncbi:hypothetical protein EFL35_07700 [Weissella paramesenteroides]|uniref:hypothetical protein n=1 Tax=Weissella paramesenteroides TaxID=1249 RepID=UPI00223A6D3B|nr:hypothetical protein [Weissella paramesenteroides]MCS9984829.1 hypothetical protein [Weissella paramesenteroides]MCS9998581.1 hypothetical protein [Weissella paramesenteroides]MCT0260304.1 hypothetical protein [Weissella paramesenteroides]